MSIIGEAGVDNRYVLIIGRLRYGQKILQDIKFGVWSSTFTT